MNVGISLRKVHEYRRALSISPQLPKKALELYHQFINLPPELRLRIYVYLFQSLVYTPDHCQRHPQASEYHEEFRENTNILCINRATRNEALPVLEKHLTVMAHEISDWTRIPSYAYNAATLRIQIRLNHIAGHLSGFTKLKKVDLYYLWETWRYHNYPRATPSFIADLIGSSRAQQDMALETCRRFGTHRTLRKIPSDIDIVIHIISGIGIRKTLPRGREKLYPCWYSLLIVDCRKRKILHRKARASSMDPWLDKAWTPVHEIAVLHQGLSFPILHNTKTGNNFYAYNDLGRYEVPLCIKGEIQSELKVPGKYEHALANAAFAPLSDLN